MELEVQKTRTRKPKDIILVKIPTYITTYQDNLLYCFNINIGVHVRMSISLTPNQGSGRPRTNRRQYQCRSHTASIESKGIPFVSGKKSATKRVITAIQPE